MLMMIGLMDLMPKPIEISVNSCARRIEGPATLASAAAPRPFTTSRRFVIVSSHLCCLAFAAIGPVHDGFFDPPHDEMQQDSRDAEHDQRSEYAGDVGHRQIGRA